MKKRILSSILALILVVFFLPITSIAAGTLSNFTKVNTYQNGQFSDVSNEWFASSVQAAYEYGLMTGTSQTTFAPNSNLTIAEAIKLAACLHSTFNNDKANFSGGTPWYQPYVDYALQKGILSSPSPCDNYTAPATRADFATIFANAMPNDALAVKNNIDDNAIPDVPIGYSYGQAVYKLYRAGVLTGSDSTGSFNPNSNIQRSEVATIVTRMANADLRKTLTLAAKELSATEIATNCSPAVFYIELESKTGTKIASASGFFISSNGLAVTNYHVIKNMIAAKITTKDGKKYDVSGVVDYSESNDLALLQINGSGFPYLQLGDSGTAVTGANIYAIGYPLGVDQTVTPGIITNASHTENGVNFIMINASISPGSSGGALVNSFGKVIGVTNSGYTNGQNLNLAVPINLLSGLSQSKTPVTLATLFTKNYTYYANYPTIPDFASVTGAQFYNQGFSSQYQVQYYYYTTSNPSTNMVAVRDDYLDQLDVVGFKYLGYQQANGHYYYFYNDTTGKWEIGVGIVTVNNTNYLTVMIMPATSN